MTMTNNPTIDGVARFWCYEARNIRCVRESDYDALQSTIAQLQARIGELESGSEPFGFWRIPEGLPLQGSFLPWVGPESERDIKNAIDFGFTVIRLYTAQPAPVAVLLPERKEIIPGRESNREDSGWNACLDATAALNGPAK